MVRVVTVRNLEPYPIILFISKDLLVKIELCTIGLGIFSLLLDSLAVDLPDFALYYFVSGDSTAFYFCLESVSLSSSFLGDKLVGNRPKSFDL